MVKTIENSLTLTCPSLKNLPDIASQIIDFSEKKGVILLEGQLGAGKTTLIKEICRQMGVKDTISSPSFSIINEYADGLGNPVYHFDFYRVKDVEEAMDIGIDEYFFSNNLCLVEWPDLIKNLVPEERIFIEIEVTGPESRIFYIKR